MSACSGEKGQITTAGFDLLGKTEIVTGVGRELAFALAKGGANTVCAVFYAERTLTKSPITLTDQAEAAYLLLSSKLAKTTGQILSVDGGLHGAFLR